VGVFGPGARCGECMLLACLRPRHWGKAVRAIRPKCPAYGLELSQPANQRGGRAGGGGGGAYRDRGSASEARKKIAARH
jgi:hypothetical protein